MKYQLSVFLARLLVNSLGIALSVRLFGTGYTDTPENFWTFVLAGFIFSVINALLRPLMVILSLPVIIVSLGLFMFLVNGLMVYLAVLLAPGVEMTFWHAVLTGIVMSLLNYIVTSVFDKTPRNQEEV